MESKVILGDSRYDLKQFEDNTFDSVITDPPAGISFMGKSWDTYNAMEFQDFMCEVFTEVLRILKPGGHALVWAIPRTSHHTAMGLERAGFYIRDVINHIFGSGFPKSMEIGRAIDKVNGTEKIIGKGKAGKTALGQSSGYNKTYNPHEYNITEPNSPDAILWNGWGTALKPATEHWILCRKPIKTSVVQNLLQHGTGAINIDACRIPLNGEAPPTGSAKRIYKSNQYTEEKIYGENTTTNSKGRFPSNVIFSHSEDCTDTECTDDCPVKELDRQSGVLTSGMMKANTPRQMSSNPNVNTYGHYDPDLTLNDTYGDTGGASRFFYVSKPSRQERNYGCGIMIEEKKNAEYRPNDDGSKGLQSRLHGATISGKNNHPTVKPIELMRYLVRMITPKGGITIDPFGGSGTTGIAAKLEGMKYVLIEKDPHNIEIINARLQAYIYQPSLF